MRALAMRPAAVWSEPFIVAVLLCRAFIERSAIAPSKADQPGAGVLHGLNPCRERAADIDRCPGSEMRPFRGNGVRRRRRLEELFDAVSKSSIIRRQVDQAVRVHGMERSEAPPASCAD